VTIQLQLTNISYQTVFYLSRQRTISTDLVIQWIGTMLYPASGRNMKMKVKGSSKTTVFTYPLAGIPGFARDEKLRKQIFEITWRNKGCIG
jgi:hypothetical protein